MRSIGSSNGTAESSAVFEDRSDKSQYVVNNTVIKVIIILLRTQVLLHLTKTLRLRDFNYFNLSKKINLLFFEC